MKKHIIANRMSEYMEYIRKHPELGETRYVATGNDLYGARGEVIIVNDGDMKLDYFAHETLKAYENYGLIKITRVYF